MGRLVAAAAALGALALVAMIGLRARPDRPAAPADVVLDKTPATTPATAPAAGETGPLDLLPADSLLAWKGLPLPDAPVAPEGGNALDVLLRALGAFAPKLDPGARVGLSIVQSFGDVIRYPFAVALIDAKAKPTGEGESSRKVDQLKIALAIRTGADAGPFARVIQEVTNQSTDEGQAELVTRTAGRWRYQELRDKRLPDWCVIAWGKLDEHYVITLGQGVWEKIAAVASGEEPSIASDPWFKKVRFVRKVEPLIEVAVSTTEIRERLDPFVHGRASAFFRAWNAEEVEKMHWSLGFEGRALYCMAYFRDTDGETRRRLYADPGIKDPRYLQTVPDEARYAIYRVSVAKLLPNLIGSYYATRSPDDRERAAALWNQIQAEHGIDCERDVLANLGETLVLHNYPPHPLRLPLAFTTLIEIEHNPEQVRATLETLLNGWREGLQRIAEETGDTGVPVLTRDDDGVWTFRMLFFAGVAWTFTDHYIITSWSPDALRRYLAEIGDRAGRPLSQQ